MFTARKDFNDYKICMQSHLNKDIAKEKCELKLYKAINSTSHMWVGEVKNIRASINI